MKKNKDMPPWNMSLRQVAVLRGVKDTPPTILERLNIKDYRKRIALDWGERVAVFTSYEKAREYLQWSLLAKAPDQETRYHPESLLCGYDRAWVTSMWVDVPVDPKIK